MSEAPTGRLAGNVYDKFSTANPVARWLVRGFKRSLLQLIEPLSFDSVLEVGCGEGYILDLLKLQGSVGVDIDLAILREASQRYPMGGYCLADGAAIPFADQTFDLVLGVEVLEHLPRPEVVIGEAKRVARRYCLFSVPREPVWRVLNMARGHYLADLGNTPGHIQHWGSGAFVRLLRRQVRVLAVRQPLPWTMALCEVR